MAYYDSVSNPPPPPPNIVGNYGGQSQNSTDPRAQPFNLGGGRQRGAGAIIGGGTATMTPEDLAAIRWAFEQSSNEFGAGQQRLAPGQFMGGAVGQGAQGNYLNPQGMDPATLERVKSELAAMFSGARKDQLQNFEARASARGGADSQGAVTGMQQIEAQNAQDLVGAITNLLMNNEQFKLSQSSTAAGLLSTLQQLEAAMNQQSAQGSFNRTFPIVPGMNGEGGAGGYQYLDENGRLLPRGNWSQAEWDAAMRERRQWEAANAA